MNDTQRARVVSIGKNVAWIVLDVEHVPRLATLKRMSGKRRMLAPGDVVEARLLEDGSALVESVEPRSFTLERRTSDGRGKTMAANVDTMVTVTAFANPPPRLTTLDQLLAFAEMESIAPMLLFTKPDLATETERHTLETLYRGLGYTTLAINPKSGEGVEDLRLALIGRSALLCGVSGVGKSSIFRALGGDAVVGALSRHGLGKQTTSAARLYRLESGFLIDSPGMAEFGLGIIGPPELAEAFPEMRTPSKGCRFNDCTHLHEPGCGVLEALERGEIAPSRYASFRRILGAPERLDRADPV
ncbi:MAG: ribosome small subunit-dependent GTPase A [Candidatus Eremiobacteraeota bacterium]|nr:ribosome small subunit-dependent GTPase A [Candidatus Eremiobacteraeota bacterium]